MIHFSAYIVLINFVHFMHPSRYVPYVPQLLVFVSFACLLIFFPMYEVYTPAYLPDLVLILPFLLSWLLFLISALCTLPLQSCLLSNTSEMLICVPATYRVNTLLSSTEYVSVNMSTKHPNPFIIPCQRYCFAIMTVFADVSCVACDQSACHCYPHYIWFPIVVCCWTLQFLPVFMVHHPLAAQLL